MINWREANHVKKAMPCQEGAIHEFKSQCRLRIFSCKISIKVFLLSSCSFLVVVLLINISKSKLSHVQTLKIYPEFKRRYLKNFTQLCCELSGARGMNAISKMAQPNAPFIRQAYVKKRQRRKFYFLMRL